MSTQVEEEVDLFELVGEMPDVACEHVYHELLHPDEPAYYYMKSHCQKCPYVRDCWAGCKHVVELMFSGAIKVYCPECKEIQPAKDVLTIIGKVKP